MVDGLVSAMQPSADAGYGLPGRQGPPPGDGVRVIELAGGAVVRLGDVTITTAENSHYSFAPDSPQAAAYKSLSFTLSTPTRSIVYTGPSTSAEELARGADLLVSEVIDLDRTLAAIKAADPSIAGPALAGINTHLSEHQLSPEAVGNLATRAKVKKVVLTHLLPGSNNAAEITRLLEGVAQTFSGNVTVAADLDRF